MLKIDFLLGKNIVFVISTPRRVIFCIFQPILFSNFKEIFFTSITDEKISMLKIDFLMGQNIVLRAQHIKLSHILHF